MSLQGAPKLMPLYSGINYAIEDEADRILAAGRRDAAKTAEKMIDYLSPEQMAFRKSKEIMNQNGVPDARLRTGMYRRAYNPDFGQRPPRNLRSHDDF